MPSPSAAFIDALYQTLWLRDGSDSDVAIGATLLDAGLVTQSQAIQDFETAPEETNFVLPIIRMYQGFFNRAPDAPGLAGWVNALRSGSVTLDQIAQSFGQSQEFATLYGSDPNPVGFVTTLYENVLGRAPELASLNVWLGLLNSGSITRAQVALDVIQSPEAINDLTPGDDAWLTAAVTPAESGEAPAYPALIPINSFNDGLVYILTTGPDVVVADAFFGTLDGSAPTLQGDDILNGVPGIFGGNVLSIRSLGDSSSKDVLPAGVTITNVQEIDLTTPGNAGVSNNAPFDVSQFAGVSLLTIKSTGPNGDFLKAGPGTDVTDTSTGAGGVTVQGGHDITINASGNAISSGADGTVTIADSNTAGADVISVTNGTSVDITTVGHDEIIAIGGDNGRDPAGDIAIVAMGGHEQVGIPAEVPAVVTMGADAIFFTSDYANSSGHTVDVFDTIVVGADSLVTVGALASGDGGSNIIGGLMVTVGPNSTIDFRPVTAPAGTNTATETIAVASDIPARMQPAPTR